MEDQEKEDNQNEAKMELADSVESPEIHHPQNVPQNVDENDEDATSTNLHTENTALDDLCDHALDDLICEICRKGDDDENMLLCDGCERGFHMYCLIPPLDAAPDGDWFCSDCESAISSTPHIKGKGDATSKSETSEEAYSKPKVRVRVRTPLQLECEKCKRLFKSQLGLEGHARVCGVAQEDLPFACRLCAKKFKTQAGYKYHIENVCISEGITKSPSLKFIPSSLSPPIKHIK
jgi:hypothetical protein